MELRSGLIIIGWLAGWWLLWTVPRLRAPGGPEATARAAARAARCSVIVPARNEEVSLAVLLESLAGQTVQPREIVVVDDQSDDATAAIAHRYPGVRVLEGEPVPVGWTGKAWACHQGTQRSSGEILVFLDADVDLAPGALAALLSEHEHRGGLLSVQPFHRMHRAYERLSALFNVIGMMGVGSASLVPARPAHGAFGPCLVTSRADHDAAGGHRAVRAEIAEDLALGRNYAGIGLPVEALGGRELISFRMYPEGLGQLVEGWSKNFATGAATVVIGRLFLIGYWVTCLLLSIQSLIELAVGRIDLALPVALGLYVLIVVQLGVMLRQLGNFGVPTAVLFPGPLAIFLVVFVRSAYLTLVRRRVMWRGRSVPLADTGGEGAAACR